MTKLFFISLILNGFILSLPNRLIDSKIEVGENFGFYIGDTITITIKVDFGSEYKLDESKLKNPGTEITPNLELKNIEILKTDNEYVIKITHQIFTAPDNVERINIPKEVLTFKSVENNEVLEIVIPTRTARISPLLQFPENPTKNPVPIEYESAKDLMNKLGFQEDIEPAFVENLNRIKILSVGFTIFSLSILVSLMTLALKHRIAFYKSPFALALGEIKDKDLRLQLKIFHEAVNTKANQTIFSHNIHKFLNLLENADLKDDLQKIFEESENLFYRQKLPADEKKTMMRIFTILKKLAKLDYSKLQRIQFSWFKGWK